MDSNRVVGGEVSIVGDSITHFFSLFLYVNSLGLTVSLKIANVSGFNAIDISSTFLY